MDKSKLEDEKEMLAVTLKSIGEGVIAANKDGEVLLINPVAEDLTGWRQEDAVGQNINTVFKIINEKTRQPCGNPIAKVLETNGIIELANRTVLISKNGTERAIADSGAPIKNQQGKTVGVVLVFSDQTEERQVRSQLEESEKKHRFLAENTLDVIWTMNLELEFTYVNPAIFNMTGYEPEEWIGSRLPDHCDEENFVKMANVIEDEITRGKEMTGVIFEAVMLKKNREPIPVEIHGKIIYDHQSTPISIQGTTRDITRRKTAEHHIRHLNRVMWAIRKINQLIVREQDPEALIQEGCRLLVHNRGYASALIVLTDDSGKPFSWAASGLAAKSDGLDEFLSNGGLPPCCDPFDPQVRVIHPKFKHSSCGDCPISKNFNNVQSLCVQMVHEGTNFGYLIAAMEQNLAVDDAELNLFSEMAGDLAFALKVLQTDMDHKESERRRKSLEGQLIQAQKMESIGRLAGGIAHDYNNMLSVIIGYAELAMDRVEPENPLYADLEEILDAANRSTDITRQLLAFARQQTIAPKMLDLNETVESMLKMLRRLIGEDINLLWFPETKLWPVKIDPAQVNQILANLCVNARDAISGIGNVTIKTENMIIGEAFSKSHNGLVPGEYVMVAVSDDGVGMAPEILDVVFEPFFTTKMVGEGTGLGLSTVYGIVKQNNGYIMAESEPGKGTTFTIYLPRQQEPIALSNGNNVEDMPSSHGETVLIVEDEESILKITRRILDRLGYSVLSAQTPGQAMELAKNHTGKIHLLITDVVMPEMHGRDLADQLKALFPDLKTLFMSGYTANVIAHRGILEEGVHFISKPFSQRKLSLSVREILDHPEL